jgi:hypothetical protein
MLDNVHKIRYVKCMKNAYHTQAITDATLAAVPWAPECATAFQITGTVRLGLPLVGNAQVVKALLHFARPTVGSVEMRSLDADQLTVYTRPKQTIPISQ